MTIEYSFVSRIRFQPGSVRVAADRQTDMQTTECEHSCLSFDGFAPQSHAFRCGLRNSRRCAMWRTIGLNVSLQWRSHP